MLRYPHVLWYLRMTYSSWQERKKKPKFELTRCYIIIRFVRFAPPVDTLYEYPLSGLCLGPEAGGATRTRPALDARSPGLVLSTP